MKTKKYVMLENLHVFIQALILLAMFTSADILLLIQTIRSDGLWQMIIFTVGAFAVTVMGCALIEFDVFTEQSVVMRNPFFVMRKCDWKDVKDVFVVHTGRTFNDIVPAAFIVISDGKRKFPVSRWAANNKKDVFYFVHNEKKLEMVKKYWHGEIKYVTLDELYLRLGQSD